MSHFGLGVDVFCILLVTVTVALSELGLLSVLYYDAQFQNLHWQASTRYSVLLSTHWQASESGPGTAGLLISNSDSQAILFPASTDHVHWQSQRQFRVPSSEFGT